MRRVKGRDLILAAGLAASGLAEEGCGKNDQDREDRPALTDRAHDEPEKKEDGAKLIGLDTEKEKAQSRDVLETELLNTEGVGLSKGFPTQDEYDALIGKAQHKLWDNRFRTQKGLERYFSVIIDDVEYRKEVRQAVRKYCELYGVPISIAYGVIGVESGGKKDATPKKRAKTETEDVVESEPQDVSDDAVKEVDYAKGLFQVKNIVLEELARVQFNGEKGWEQVDLNSVDGNAKAWVANLRHLFVRYGQWGIALIAHRLGQGTVEERLLEQINQHNLDAFSVLEKVADLRDDSKAIAGPKIWTKDMVREREWLGFLKQRGVGAAFVCSDKGLGLGAKDGWEFPFRVEAISPTVSGILESDEAHPVVEFGAPGTKPQ